MRLKISPFHKKLFLLLLGLSILSLAFKLLSLWHSSTAFTYDQARDLLDLREMFLLKKLRLIGANTSLHGVFYGPFWYWLCFPFYLISGGNPESCVASMLMISTITSLILFFLLQDKRLALFLSLFYLFSQPFFSYSIIALNTNPIVFLTIIFLVLIAKFFQTQKKNFVRGGLFLMGASFHFEPIVGIFWLPIYFVTAVIFKKVDLLLKNKKAFIFFLLPFLPQLIFEFRHGFIQSKAVFSLLGGKGSSLTPDRANFLFRLQDRLRIFKNVFLSLNVGNEILAIVSLTLIIIFLLAIIRKRKIVKEEEFLGLTILIFLFLIFLGFSLYPYALWPWYLGTVDAMMITLIGLGFYFLFKKGSYFTFLSLVFLAVFLFLNITRYLVWPPNQVVLEDEANLRRRIRIVDLIYQDAGGKGFNLWTFAPYVYDYPYQYLVWWQAKTRYHYLPNKYVYLDNQPAYVRAKKEADSLFEERAATCDYLIIEPFYSQPDWFKEWRGHFGSSQKTWEEGKTRVEKLCP